MPDLLKAELKDRQYYMWTFYGPPCSCVLAV